MSLIKYKPITPSMRGVVLIDKSNLWNGKPFKRLTSPLINSGGRNNRGRITIYHRGGGHKRKYRIIDFKRRPEKEDRLIQHVISIQYDPNRTGFVALLKDNYNKYSYILAPEQLKVGDILESGNYVDIKVGHALELRNIPVGTLIYNLEIKPGKGAQLVRAAGNYAQLVKKTDNGYAMIRLPSGELRLIMDKCYATIGVVSNIDHKNINKGKAGRSRWMNRRPIVRGVAMNPIDHPHGGGEGRTSGGRPSVTPWGKPTKGKPTRAKNKSNKFIIQRKKK